jgi:hypothetical protein
MPSSHIPIIDPAKHVGQTVRYLGAEKHRSSNRPGLSIGVELISATKGSRRFSRPISA